MLNIKLKDCYVQETPNGKSFVKSSKSSLDDSSAVKKMVALAGEVQSIQADGHELAKCCEILGRTLPKVRVYTFFGDNANEIVANWCEFD